MDVVSKNTGDSYTAAEFNESNNELENTLASTGQTPSSGDLFQVAKAVSDYASHGDFYTDSGAADAYVLAAQGSKQTPTAYAGGFRARFIVGNTNTGASTVNIATLGVKNIKRRGGAVLSAGDLVAGRIVMVEYDGTDFIFEVGDSGVVQQVNVMDGEVDTGTTLIPRDDTIPQNTEGDEYITASITPTNSNHILEIEAIINVSHSATSTRHLVAALFQDSTANALITATTFNAAVAGLSSQLIIKYKMIAGTTSSTTFKIRAGCDVAGTTTFNGTAGGRLYGGVLLSSITITEIKQ